MTRNLLFVVCAVAGVSCAQDRTDLKEILARLERVEAQNRELREEVRQLKEQIGAPAESAPAVEERVAVQERRVEELEQSKVTAEQRLPVTLTGTVLFNAYRNGRYNGGDLNPVVASLDPGPNTGGGTLRQTVLGLKFRGPTIAGGGQVSGSLYLDLFAGSGSSLNQLARLRVATVDLAWNRTTVSFGQDKPIMAPREPDSLAQVGISPLTGAGNLWLWQPQFRIEHRIPFGAGFGLNLQGGVYQTAEDANGVPDEYASTLASSRPGWEGRFVWWGGSDARRFEIAPSFHISQSHVEGQSIPSRIWSVDWLLRPLAQVEFTGQYFAGENVGVIGGLRQGIRFLPYERVFAVRAQGGWAQLKFRATDRLTFHLYGGQQDDRDSDLGAGSIAKNQGYGANAMYRFGQNVIGSFEASQARTTYLRRGTRLVPHYDLAIAYLF